jgi:hypothetical protein
LKVPISTLQLDVPKFARAAVGVRDPSTNAPQVDACAPIAPVNTTGAAMHTKRKQFVPDDLQSINVIKLEVKK